MSIDPYAAQPSAAVPLDKPLYGASFGQAVSRFFKKYGTFSGRASRSEFWWVQLFTTLVAIVLTIVIIAGAVATSGPDVSEPGTGIIPGLILLIIFALAIIVPGIAVTVRRLHDANFSGWFYLLTLTSVGGIIVLVFTLLEPKPEGARFDADFNGQFPGQPGVYPMQPGQYPGSQYPGAPTPYGTPGHYPGASNPPAANPYGTPGQTPPPPNPYGTPGQDPHKPGA
ncbi:DUF805 domain-containing protein [Paeniglutamicibacter cryotolerans]|uniref:Uncharacterized membrane protein YhaH (DUF805 family) n=1 Tax=Paeniglutamicibacter cryotolerans TaxID=670079 RepID=A0A839QFN6_9MICC|nr:DUF805 domain-containing protein [Paeniglutamicibacter cryotolerans]MBB2994710.1 uncharacterized membrane protein YhaH (DUF805 family) [Paeniglutamicibacter cryotolerans]